MRLTTAYSKIRDLDGRYRVVQGGTRAGKTFAILQYLIALAELRNNIIITICTNTLPALRIGAMRDFQLILKETNHWIYFEENKTTHTFTCKPTGSIIEFLALDEDLKARGPARDVLFVNEANRIKYDVFDQLSTRTSEFIFLDYNPSARFWVHDKIVPLDDASFTVLTYLDNEEIPPNIKANIESHDRDSNWWKVYGLGQIGELEGNIFRGWEFLDRDELPKERELLGYGLDFGFRPDPCALVSLWRADNRMIAIEEWIQHELTPEQIVGKVAMTTLPNTLIVADNARPEIIAQMQQAGLQTIACVKQENIAGVLSGVNAQLEEMSQVKFLACGDHLEEEYLGYQYTTTRDGTFTSKVPKGKDHCVSGDTLIETLSGAKRIDELVGTVGYALTDRGYRPYYLVEPTSSPEEWYVIETEAGHSICVTSDHLFMTDKGLLPAYELSELDSLRYNSLYDKNISDFQRKKILATERREVSKVSQQMVTPRDMETLSRRNTKKLGRTPYRPRSTQQSYIESAGNAEVRTPQTSRERRNYESETTGVWQNPVEALRYATQTVGDDTARKAMVSRTLEKLHRENNTNREAMFGVWKNFYDESETGKVLSSELQTAWAYTEIKRVTRKLNQSALAYRIEIDGGLILTNGLLTHNCLDALRYVWYWTHRESILKKAMADVLKEYK